ncbi:MAG: low temperature requirement protein A [Rhodoplanes sp.]|uniref:low temperature requirement protein A n=1 Tax=Rhodoplanes sp. TaxID=1968906 RepID=UPI00180BA892|nr:low temperature requirement protein A [Rhodoplanes sp.]NVO17629.1 low temperature requirement protein A [Rhodoplanes sp.]
MISAKARAGVLRTRSGEHERVTYVELFFDLVFVFAITQLSHLLLEHPTSLGMLQTAMLLSAVWWVWIDTSWVTNWLDPQTVPVRIMLFVLMLAGLVLSTSIPLAFETRALPFAGAYVLMQLGRSLFVLWATRRTSPGNYLNFKRITAWAVLSAPLWIAGALVDGEARYLCWGAALALDFIAPATGFWTPGLGGSATGEWDVEGHHIAERCALFTIIALGESILVTGVTFGRMDWTAPTVAAAVTAFVGSIAMWWIYFNIGAEQGTARIASSDDPGRLARLAYTYVHLLPIAGIIVAAVADELVLAHPSGHTDLKTAAAVIGGNALFLVGNLMFKRILLGRPALSHMVGLGLLLLLAPAALVLSPLAFAAAGNAVLVVVAVWETWSLRGLVEAEEEI